MIQFNKKNILVVFAGLLMISTAFSCSSMEKKQSTAVEEQDVDIVDPAAYQQAKEKANLANRQLVAGNFKSAERLVDESLKLHETFIGRYLKGVVQYHGGLVDDSLKSFGRAEEIRPEDEQLLMTMATVYLGKGEVDQAMDRYMRLHTNYPHDPIYAYKVGTTYKLKREYPQAYEYLKKAEAMPLDGFPHPDRLYLQLGDVALELKKFEESETYFKKASELNPQLADARKGGQNTRLSKILEEGNQALAAKDYDGALQKYRSASDLEPDAAAPHFFIAQTLLIQEKYGEADTEAREGRKLDPRSTMGYSIHSRVLMKLKKNEEAERVAQEGLAVAPENAMLYNQLGVVRRDSGKPRGAIDAFFHAVNLEPGNADYRLNLGYAYLDDDRFSDSQREFQNVQGDEEQNGKARRGLQLVEVYSALSRGNRFLEEDRPGEALKEFAKAKKMDESLPAVWTAEGRAYLDQKKYSRSENAFQKALALDQSHIPALQGMIRLYTKKRDWKTRRVYVRKLESLTSDNLIAAITLGRMLEDEKKYEQAIKHYRGLIKKYPQETAPKRRLGYVYYRLGMDANDRAKYKEARAYFLKAKDVNPEIPQLAESLEIVEENIKYSNLLPELKKAEYYYDRKDYRMAYDLYSKVYTKLKRPLILVRIAECKIGLGKEKEGLNMLENASISSPGDTEILEAINVYLLKNGKIDRAEKGFHEIIARKENAYYSHYKLGVISIKRGKEKESIDHFTRSLIYKPDFSVANLARGVAYYHMGKNEDAKRDFEEAARKDEDSPLPKYNIGVMLFDDDLIDQAEKVFQEVVKKYPDFLDSRYHLSFIYYSRDHLDEAEKEIRQVIDLAPESRYYHALAKILEKKYEKQATTPNRMDLKTVYSQIVTLFPNETKTEEVREKMTRLDPEYRIAQPYNIQDTIVAGPILANDNLIYAERQKVVSVASSRKKPEWEVDVQLPVLDLLVDRWIYVLMTGKVLVLDPVDGTRLATYDADRTATSLMGGYGNLAILGRENSPVAGSKKTVSLPTMTIIDASGKNLGKRTGSKTISFHSRGTDLFELDRSANGVEIRKLSSIPSDSPVAILPIEGLSANHGMQIDSKGDTYFFIFPGEGIAVVERNGLQLKKVIPLDDRERIVRINQSNTGATFLIPGKEELTLLDEDGESKKAIALKDRLYSPTSVNFIDDGLLLVVDRKRKVLVIDQDGDSKWDLELPDQKVKRRSLSNVLAAFSLYY